MPYLWLLVFFLVPFLIVFKISLSDTAIALPPYTPVFDLADGLAGFVEACRELSFDNYLLAARRRALYQRLSVEPLDRRRLDAASRC